MMWYITAFVFPLLFVYLNGQVFNPTVFGGALPELSVISIMYFANNRGIMPGQLIGFTTGLTLDFLSAAPLGYFTLIFTVLGFIAGNTRGKIYLDPIFTPVLMVLVALLLKAFLSYLLSGIFGFPEARNMLMKSHTLFEILYSLLATPLMFAFYRFVDRLFPRKNRGGYQS